MKEIQTLDGRTAIVTESVVTFHPIDSRFKLGMMDLDNILTEMKRQANKFNKEEEYKALREMESR